MAAHTAPISDNKPDQNNMHRSKIAANHSAKKYKKERDALASLLGQLHLKVKTFKTSLETGDLGTLSYKSP